MVRIYQPRNEPEVAVLRSILMSCEIPHLVQSDHLGRLLAGSEIPHLNTRAICVEADCADDARAVTKDWLEATGGICYHPTGTDKIRNVLEFLFIRWFIPFPLRGIDATDECDEQSVA